ncbi:MAG: BatA domain-containing protein [Lishizhenia sp.]
MKFAYPEFLFAFLVLLIPIIIHLFNFRKYKTLYFSSLQFLKNVEEQTKSTQKLKHILVLISRLLAFSLLVLAFAQPYLPKSNTNVSTKQPLLAIYLDNSFSMESVGTNGELLSEGRETVRKIVEEAAVESSFLLFTNALSGVEQRLASRREVLNRLDEIETSPIQKDIGTVLSLQKEVIQKENWEGPVQYISISDFQKVTSAFENVAIDSAASYYPIQLKAQSLGNVYIDSIWFSSPLRKVNRNNELNVRVKNNGNEALKNVQLTLDVSGNERTILIDIGGNDFSEAVFNYTDQTTGIKEGVLEIYDQQLYFDDAFYFSYQVNASSDILIIDGEKSLKNASYVYETDDFYKVNTIGQNQLTRDKVVGVDLILLNGLNSISSGQQEVLTAFAENGGSLFIIPGNNLQLNSFNSFLSALDMPRFNKVVSAGLTVSELNDEDAFFEGIFQKKPKKLNLPYVQKAYEISARTFSNAVTLLGFENRKALLLKSMGTKKVYVLSTALQEDFSKITNHALFAALLLRAGELSQRNNALYAVLGETDSYQIESDSQSENVIHIQNESVDFIPPVQKKANFSLIQLNSGDAITNLKSGIFSVKTDKLLSKIGLNYTRKESDISVYDVEKIASKLRQLGAKNVTSSTISNLSEIATLDIEKPTEYWRILLIFALVFFTVEMLLLKFLNP